MASQMLHCGWCGESSEAGNFYKDCTTRCKSCRKAVVTILRVAELQNKKAQCVEFMKYAPLDKKHEMVRAYKKHPALSEAKRRKIGHCRAKPAGHEFNFSQWF